ncbi:MAG: glycosyltransferase family 4 protein [Anaerolineaceae bacterium]|nr:glycosyltransferase family 4 protein [Anaerolineaceae bacterium]
MREGLKIAMMINGYYPRVGGAERQLGSIAPRLKSRGMDVHILTRRQPGLASYELVEGVPVHRLPVPGPKPVASFSYTLSAIALLLKIKPDILHAHELFSATTTAVAAKAILKQPVVVTTHSSGNFGDVKRLRNKLLGEQRLEIFRRSVDYFVTISNLISQELQATGVSSKKLVNIPNAVDTEHFRPLSSVQGQETRENLRRRLSLPPDAVIAIYTGRLSREKRPENLLEIWPQIYKVFPKSLLLMLGTGPQEQELKSKQSNGVKMLGNIKDVLPYLQVSDLFILPSWAEGLPVSLLEAMACGLPAVATAVGGTPEVLEDKITGLLVPTDDLPALEEAALKMLADLAMRKRMGQEGRKQVVERFSLEMAVDKLSELYERIAKEEGGKA